MLSLSANAGPTHPPERLVRSGTRPDDIGLVLPGADYGNRAGECPNSLARHIPFTMTTRVRITAWGYTLIITLFILAAGFGFAMDARAAGPAIFDEITGHTPLSNYYALNVPIEIIAAADRTGLYTEDDAEVGSMSAQIRFVGAEDTCTLQGFKFRIYGPNPAYLDSEAADLVLTKDTWTTVNREFSGSLYEIQTIESWKYDITGESPAGCWSANSYGDARWGVAADYYGGTDTYFYGGAATDIDALVAFYKPELEIENVLSVRASTTLALTWDTTVAADTLVRWGTDTNYLDGEIWHDDLETSHTETIMALTPNSVVYWEICAATVYPAEYTEVCYQNSSLTTPPTEQLTSPECSVIGDFTWTNVLDLFALPSWTWEEGDGIVCAWDWTTYIVQYLVLPNGQIGERINETAANIESKKPFAYVVQPLGALATGLDADNPECPMTEWTFGTETFDLCDIFDNITTAVSGDNIQTVLKIIGALAVVAFGFAMFRGFN